MGYNKDVETQTVATGW